MQEEFLAGHCSVCCSLGARHGCRFLAVDQHDAAS